MVGGVGRGVRTAGMIARAEGPRRRREDVSGMDWNAALASAPNAAVALAVLWWMATRIERRMDRHSRLLSIQARALLRLLERSESGPAVADRLQWELDQVDSERNGVGR